MPLKTPKILPWLARRAGVSDERAAELWADAIRYATLRAGWVGTSDYWRIAMDKLVDLLDAERLDMARQPLSRLVRLQVRMWMLPLTACHAAMGATTRHWDRWFSRSTVAH